MESMRRNVESKARCADLAAARAVACQLCGDASIIEQQCDTYFHVAHGRLKLREIEGQPAVLIAYRRPDTTEARTSAYRLVPVPDSASLKAALADTLGVRGTVRKRREIFLWKNVRIHLDRVEGLGDFIEFEAVLRPEEAESEGRRLLQVLVEQFLLQPAQLVGPSYSDLLGI
jgi:predicted adenylyl cyclase CyaB